jgi:phosphatidylserine decarboxylase
MTREGVLFPLPFFAIAIILFLLFRQNMNITFLYFSAAVFYIGLAMMLFFRDPERKVPRGDDLIVSPADGRIIKWENNSENQVLSIFLSLHNVHVNRSPVDGTIKSIKRQPGKFHAAFRNEAMTENERNEIEIETQKGIVKMHQVAGKLARRTVLYKKAGDSVSAGERIGLIRFGSRVDLYLPASSEMQISLKQKVLAGQSILGHLR